MKNKTNILYVEDNTDYLAFVRKALQKIDADLELQTANDGFSAMDFFNKTKNDKTALKLILLDINLPGMTGIELLQKIRAFEGMAFTPIIMFSTSDNPCDVKNCYDNGANAYVVKPAGINPLMNSLKSMCDFWLGYNYRNTDEVDKTD